MLAVLQLIQIPEAPENAEAGNAGILRGEDIHLAVADIDTFFDTQIFHGLIEHIRRWLSGARSTRAEFRQAETTDCS